jgi:threonine synthase
MTAAIAAIAGRLGVNCFIIATDQRASFKIDEIGAPNDGQPCHSFVEAT